MEDLVCQANITAPVLHELFERTCKSRPELPAVQWKDAELSYAELESCAAALAGWLVRRGACRGSIIGLLLDRSLELVVAVIGTLKTGSAYLPLLPKWPSKQRLEILAEAECQLLVLQGAFRNEMAGFSGVSLEFENCRKFAKTEPPPSDPVQVAPTDAAYVIYTSGSTGKPKGVVMHHGGTASNIDRNAPLSCEEGTRCCFSSNFTFDVHVADIFKPLSVGATVVVTRDIFRIPPVDVVSTVPSKVAMAKVPKALKVIMFTGEGVNESCIRPIPPTTRVLNIFGATEFFDATLKVVDCSVFPPARLQSIGKPLGKYVPLWVVDPVTRHLRPVGEPGELVVGGFQVAKGYVKRPELNAEKFFDAPWLPGEGNHRVYRTGDLVRCCEDGEFEYLGRAAHQVEIRGQRIDLSAIEAALAAVEGVTGVAVVVRHQSPPQDTQEEKLLVAYVSPSTAKTAAANAQKNLPSSVAPDLVEGIDDWPRTSSGKIDRVRLAALDAGLDNARLQSMQSMHSNEKAKRLRWMFRDPEPSASKADKKSDSDGPNDDDQVQTQTVMCRELAISAVDACEKHLSEISRLVYTQVFRRGLVLLTKFSGFGPAEAMPVALVPDMISLSAFEELRRLAPIFSRVIDKISCSFEWLHAKLSPLRSSDAWLARLLDLAAEVYGPKGAGKDPCAEIRLLLQRQDYLPNSDGHYLQVEINTIAVAHAGWTEQLARVHADCVSTFCPDLCTKHDQLLKDNVPGSDFARALAAAHAAYVRDAGVEATQPHTADRGVTGPRVCFFCWENDFFEMDQRLIEVALNALGVPTFFASLGARVDLRGGDAARSGAGGQLFINGVEVSVVYFHSTYEPGHFACEADWTNRRLIELSKAVKAPSLLGHLAGTKKVQQLLSNQKELQRLLDCEEDIARCMAVFAKQLCPTEPASIDTVQRALSDPDKWVLKPQREGGGNNLFGEELKMRLCSTEGGLDQFVLMEKIQSVPQPTLLQDWKGGHGVRTGGVSELGIFAAHLAHGTQEVLSTSGGAVLRTKPPTSLESGICSRSAMLSTPFLVGTCGAC